MEKMIATVLVMAWSLTDRTRQIGRDDSGEAGGKGVIILIATVIGIGAMIGVGALIATQISNRSPGLGQ